MRLSTWAILVPCVAAAVTLAVANRAPVRLSFDPLSAPERALGVDVPLYLIILGAVFVGLLLGGWGVWAAEERTRRALRALRRDVKDLRARTG